jgi:hypothetical protein
MSWQPPTPSPPAPAFRPQSLGEILDEAFRLYRRNFGLLFVIALLLALPGLAQGLASAQSTSFATIVQRLASGRPIATLPATPPSASLNDLASAFGLLELLIVPFSLGTVIRAGLDIAQGGLPSLETAFRGTARRYWALWGLFLLYLVVFVPLLVAAFGLVVLATVLHAAVVGVLVGLIGVVVAIWVGVRWAVAVPTLLQEGVGPVRALQRSWELVGGRWWRTFGILIVTYLLILVVEVVVGGVLAVAVLPVQAVASGLAAGLGQAAGAVVGALVAPVSSLVLVLLYRDLRIRREGWGLDQLAQGVPST